MMGLPNLSFLKSQVMEPPKLSAHHSDNIGVVLCSAKYLLRLYDNFWVTSNCLIAHVKVSGQSLANCQNQNFGRCVMPN